MALAIEGLTVHHVGRAEPALLDLSLTVAPGELVTVAGRTGAGKTTLALAAAGFIPRVVRARVNGAVRLGDLVLSAPTTTARTVAGRVGIVFSTPADQLSASKLTVREELAFGLENLAVPRTEMDLRIDEVLDRLGIAPLAEREPLSLSGGEQQRVAIASILVMGTAAIVLDEPTAQLDPAASRSVADLLVAEAGLGRTILCTEHDPLLLGRSVRCLVLDAGRGIALASPGAALSDAVLGPIGLQAPTLVRLAARAGLPASRAFDEAAVAEALRTIDPGRVAADPAAADSPTTVHAIERREPVDIAVRDLHYRYPGGVEVLRGIDLEIAAGERVAIVGQNGSGKTTLAKHLVGLLRPAGGRVEIGGNDIAGRAIHEVARTVGFAFQDPAEQLFERTVEREVAFGPRNLGLVGDALAERVSRAIELVGLDAIRTDNPFDLGPSIRRLVALASVLAMDPAILVLDEPTTGQDGPGIERVGAIVEAYGRAGRTVIAITHDMELAAASFDRVVVMRDGLVIADGSPRAVFAPDQAAALASTGLDAPVSARIGAQLGLGSTPTEAALLAALAARTGSAAAGG